MMLCLEKKNVTFLNTKIYSMQYEENAYVSVIGIIETGSYLRFAIANSVLRTDKGTCTPTWCVHPPTTTEVVTRIRDYDPENLFVCVSLFFFYLRTPPNAPRPRNLTEYAKLPNWIRL